ISPTGWGNTAFSRTPSAIAATLDAASARRSTNAASLPAPRRRDVLRVGGQQAFLVANDCQGDCLQRGILCCRRRPREEARRRSRALADLAHVRGQVQTSNIEVGHAGYSIPIGGHEETGPVERTKQKGRNGV